MSTDMLARQFTALAHGIYTDRPIPLHRPVFDGPEREWLVECIDSNFVSSVGARVTEFEQRVAEFVGARFGIAVVNGTNALHVALRLAGVEPGSEVITQPLTFVATCNAIAYAGAVPVFVDVDADTLGLSPEALERFLDTHAVIRDGRTVNWRTGRPLAACMPMHTFGLPCRIQAIVEVCQRYGVPVVEDAAESLGSWADGRHTGTFGQSGVFSFNGNKIITTGGGGMIVTDDEALAQRAKHLTTTAKQPHPYEFVHDELGYNYRMPNLNATLGCAQMEQLPAFLEHKRELHACYARFFADAGVKLMTEPEGTRANHWLNAIVLPDRDSRDAFLQQTNDAGVMTRPIWRLMTSLPMYGQCQHDGCAVALDLEQRVVNLPSSVPVDADGHIPERICGQ